MAKIKLTKNELKRQKDALKRYQRYLPMLQLKKQQLQMEIAKILAARDQIESEMRVLTERLDAWVAVFGEDVRFGDLLTLDAVETTGGNIAGVDIPVFSRAVFREPPYDVAQYPLWVDDGIIHTREMMTLRAKRQVLEKQLVAIREELRVTNQRVNLFEKVKIPETKEDIRRIRIFLGDMQTAGVVTGKIAKKKVERKALERAL